MKHLVVILLVLVPVMSLVGCIGGDHEHPDPHDARVDHDQDGVPDIDDIDPWADIEIYLNWTYDFNSTDWLSLIVSVDEEVWDIVTGIGPLNGSRTYDYDWPDDRVNLSFEVEANDENQTGDLIWTGNSYSWTISGVLTFEVGVEPRS